MAMPGPSAVRSPLSSARRILIAIDGGSGSRAAPRWAAEHAGPAPASIDLVCVAPDGTAAADADSELRAGELVMRTLLEDARVESHLRQGHPVDQLALAVTELGADLLVIGTHASPDRPQPGRVTVPGRLAARAACTVVVVPADWAPSAGAIVVGNSIDAASDRALDFAVDIASGLGRELVVTHVWELPTVGEIRITPGGGESIPERQAAGLADVVLRAGQRAPQITIRADLRRGDPVAGLTAAAEGAALLVVGRRERGALASILGSTSRGVVSAPPCPVAVVPEDL